MHPDQGRIRRALEELGDLWRRSGGSLHGVSSEELRAELIRQAGALDGWEPFLATRFSLDPRRLVPEDLREALMHLPSVVRLHGDAVALDYEVEDGIGVVRLRMKEGQAARLQPRDLPALDRPLRFTVVRGSHAALRAATLGGTEGDASHPPADHQPRTAPAPLGIPDLEQVEPEPVIGFAQDRLRLAGVESELVARQGRLDERAIRLNREFERPGRCEAQRGQVLGLPVWRRPAPGRREGRTDRARPQTRPSALRAGDPPRARRALRFLPPTALSSRRRCRSARMASHLLEQGVPVVEVIDDEALRAAGPLGDLLDRPVGQALSDEDGPGGAQDGIFHD